MLESKKMTKIHSIIMPYFRTEVPPLGIACLNSYLKKHNLILSCTDFRLFKNDIQATVSLGYRDNFVMDIADLPLILTIIKNYREGRFILEGMDKVIKDYVRDRPLSILKLKQDIVDIYNIISCHLKKLLCYEIILFTTYETNFFFTIMCTLLLRQQKRDIFIVYGGPQVTQSDNSRKLVLKLGLVDTVVIGEGEKALLDIIRSYKAAKPMVVKGTMTYDSNKDQFNINPADPLDINSLPCPDFSVLNLRGYPKMNFFLPLYTSRGCLFRCNFCDEWRAWYPFRQMEPEKVVSWMKDLHRKYGAFQFYFSDSLLNASFSWLEEFSDRLQKEKLDFQWRGCFRANMTRELAQRLKKSGLFRAFIGTEAFTEQLLKSMDKKRTPLDNLKAIEAFCEAGILLEISNIIGFPYESNQDFEKRWNTFIDLFKKYPMSIIVNNEPFQLRPSSRIFDNLDDFGLTIKYWGPKIINMLPEVNPIVSKIAMSVKGRPGPGQITQRLASMQKSFLLGSNEKSKFNLRCEKDFLSVALKYIKPESKILFSRGDIHCSHLKTQGLVQNNLFLLHWRNGKNVISQEEKMIFEGLINQKTISEIAQGLTVLLNKNRAYCIKIIIKFLNDMLEMGLLFEITYKNVSINK